MHAKQARILAHVPGVWSARTWFCEHSGVPAAPCSSGCENCSATRTAASDPGLLDLYRALIATERPNTVAAWLDRRGGPGILRRLEDAGALALSHEVLDELPAGKPVEHLRSLLVAIGALPHRDGRMLQLQRWTAELIAGRAHLDQRNMLHRYAIWHVIRRLRGRVGDADTSYGQATAPNAISKPLSRCWIGSPQTS